MDQTYGAGVLGAEATSLQPARTRARPPKVEARESGLYKNGSRWWLSRVRSPLSNTAKPLSTGTKELSRANTVKRTVDALLENRQQWEWLELAVTGELTLDTITNHFSAGTLHLLREERAQLARQRAEPDLDPIVTQWIKEHVEVRDISARMKETYARQIRTLIPAGVAFPASQFTEDTLKAKLASISGARHDRTAKITGGSRRRYVVAWQLFYKFARRRVKDLPNPFEDTEWLPRNGDARAMAYEHDKVLKVLEQLDGEDKAAIALMFGSGIELGALLTMRRGDVNEREKTIIAHGTKNEFRKLRAIFVREWAWKIFWAHAETFVSPRASLWTFGAGGAGALRERFYWAQVRAGLIDEPQASEATGKLRWGRVSPHTLHDCRHSLCVNAGLGLDGEDAWDTETLAHQLGHRDEQMVIGVYKRTNIRERQRRLLARRKQTAQATRA